MNLNNYLSVGVSAAKLAGEYLSKNQHKIKVIATKNKHDWLLEQDKKSEEIIISTIKKHFPDHGIIAEESGELSGSDTYQWMIDPLDGSFNYQHGWPIYGIAIGLFINKSVKVSIIYLPFFDELYTAVDGKGAYLNGEKIHVSDVDDLHKSVILMGDYSFDANGDVTDVQLVDMTKLATAVSRVRMIGSAAMDQALIARGKADGLVARASKPWDTFIGKKLIEEAGGKAYVNYSDTGNIFLFSNNALYKKLTSLIT